jgi:hypothetical protein
MRKQIIIMIIYCGNVCLKYFYKLLLMYIFNWMSNPKTRKIGYELKPCFQQYGVLAEYCITTHYY